MNTNKKKEILWRMWLAILMPVLFGVAIVSQTFFIQINEGKALRQLADSLTIKAHVIEPERGNIYADDGSLLSTSLPYFEVRMDFRSEAMTDDIFNANVDSLAFVLNREIGAKSANEYKKSLIAARQKGNRYFLIKRNVNFPFLKKMYDWPFFKLGRYKSGMIVIQKSKREAPFGVLAYRTIGYKRIVPNPGIEGRMDTLRVGIEGNFDDYLAGVEGQMLMQRIAGGTYIPLNGKGDIQPRAGLDVHMTIDVNFQDVVESALKNGLETHNADHGCAVLMEVATGKVKAIANLTYRKEFETYVEYYNYAVGASTEPGSTFKLMTYAALLDDGHIELDDKVDIEGGVKEYSDRTMKDVYVPENDTISIVDAFATSSNVGISKLATKYYGKNQKRFYDKLVDMHLTKPVGIEIVGESTPTIYPPSDWSAVSLPWISMGYEVELSPLQTLTFYNAIANGGVMMKPYLVESIKNYDKVVKEFEPVVIDKSVVSSSTVGKLKKLMEAVVLRGSGKRIKNANVQLAGKTGTSRIANANTAYSDKIYQASFAGYFPADNPLYSCIVVISNPRNGSYYGSSVAAPIFSEIAQKVYATGTEMHPSLVEKPVLAKAELPRLGNVNATDASTIYNNLGVSYHSTQNEDYGFTKIKDNSVSLEPNPVLDNIVPNVRGMDLRDALFVCENAGLKVKVVGSGKVKRQSFPSGDVFVDGQTMTIELGL